MFNEISPSDKTTYYIIPTIGYFGKGQTIDAIKRSVVSRRRGAGKG